MNKIELIDCKSAKEFVDYLLPNQERWRRAPWFFRGHGDAAWPLLPTLERKSKWGWENWEPYIEAESQRERIKERHKGKKYVPWAWYAEVAAVTDFTSVLARSGLALPGDHALATDAINVGLPGDAYARLMERTLSHEKELALWPYLALGQHYGLPTRLLDWTTNSLVAAYFAAQDNLSENGDGPQKIAVWAVNGDAVAKSTMADLVWLPTHANPNMATQEGLFTRVRALEVLKRDDPSLMFLDKALAESEELSEWPKRPFLRRVTLPASESAECWCHLRDFSVDARRAWPGPRGVAEYARERRWVIHRLKRGVKL